MTKARDLANAGTALTTVSATELGYLDGVTSAVQTQINSKIGQSTAINPTIVDAKGDIVAATAADTVARLAVGANDTVLTADSSTATGLKWATPAGGASGLTLISVQTFSGSSGINIDNVFTSTYTNYRLVFSNVTTSTDIYVSYRERAGGTTNATNYKKGQYYRPFASAGFNSGGTEGNLFDLDTNSTSAMGATLELQNPATTAFTGFQWAASTFYQAHTGTGIHSNAVAYDGFALFPYTGTMSGTVHIYGYQKAV